MDEGNEMGKNNREGQKVGFGYGEAPTSTIYDKYIGKCISTSYNGHSAVGILKVINRERGFAELQPAVVSDGKGFLDIQRSLPVQMPFPLGPVYPLTESLEEWVLKHNEDMIKEDMIKGKFEIKFK